MNTVNKLARRLPSAQRDVPLNLIYIVSKGSTACSGVANYQAFLIHIFDTGTKLSALANFLLLELFDCMHWKTRSD